MKQFISCLSFVFCAVSALAARAEIDFSGLQGLVGRMGGAALSNRVTFVAWTSPDEGRAVAPRPPSDRAEIVPNSDRSGFTVRATSVHAGAVALGVYLRDVAKGHVSTCGNRMPTTWPVPKAPMAVQPREPMAMAYNYCTLSYTFAFWSERDWRKEIDRLALSGFNTALVMVGVPKIWRETLREAGYTARQRQDFIVDDAGAAWWLMGNMQALGDGTEEGHYPVVSDAVIERDAQIGRWLVREMRAVGIEPVFQGFVGLVPSTTTETQLAAALKLDANDPADVRIFRNGLYCDGQKNPDLIDPNCKAFGKFIEIWDRHLMTVYGLTRSDSASTGFPRYLGGDLFHESAPPATMTVGEKVNCARGVQRYQQADFPGVTWVLQSWQGSPVQELRDGLDARYTLIQFLDQAMNRDASRGEVSFRNRQTGAEMPWVWAEVMNFGGNTGMHGAFTRFRTLGELGAGNANFRGYGLLSEGLETNPVSYDMFAGALLASTREAQDIAGDAALASWLEAYRLRRYGYTDDNLGKAQAILAETVWNCTCNQQGTIESLVCAQPDYAAVKASAWGPTTGTPYDRLKLVEAARLYFATAKRKPAILKLETFRYDFVEICQQLIADYVRDILPDCATSQERRTEFRELLVLLEEILECSDDWRLDAKEARVKAKAGAEGVAAYRRMVTTWTPGARGQTQLSNYAHRSYAGLVKYYYAKKWNAFLDVTEGKKTQAQYGEISRALDARLPTAKLPKTPGGGNPVAIAEKILALCGRDGPRRVRPDNSHFPSNAHFYVTEAGAVSVNMPGKAYATFAEALAAQRAAQKAAKVKKVKLWILSQEVFEAAKAEVDAYNAAKGTRYTVFGDGNGIEVRR